jgi:acyl-coenzyme A thioesterase PaaI-like protein
MSTAEHGQSPYDTELDGLSAAWLGRAELGAQPGFSAMIEALRALQDQVTGSAPPDSVLAEATRQLTELTRQLAAYPVDEHGQIAGHLADVPGRGQALTPPMHVEEVAPGKIRARVTFGRYYLGGNGAVHGGAIPLVFDELMGRLASTGGTPARTAFLHINYRNITPIESPLTVEVHLAAQDGRKRHMRGELRGGATLCADAEALFVALRPGQP